MATCPSLGALIVVVAVSSCGGAAPPAAPTGIAPRCAIPVAFANQSGWSTSALEARATPAAHDTLVAEHACDRGFKLAFALDAATEEPGVMRAELNVTVLSASGAILATSSVTVRIPKPVSESDASAAIAKASAFLARQAAQKVR